jgi:hypothetical protein
MCAGSRIFKICSDEHPRFYGSLATRTGDETRNVKSPHQEGAVSRIEDVQCHLAGPGMPSTELILSGMPGIFGCVQLAPHGFGGLV